MSKSTTWIFIAKIPIAVKIVRFVFFYPEDPMKRFLAFSIVLALVFFMFSCGGGDENIEAAGKSCTRNEDCGEGKICDTEQKVCVNDTNSGSDSGSAESQDSDSGGNEDNGESEDPGSGGIYVTCTPGETQPCYEGPSGTQDVGICKAGVATCVEDGTDWSECVGQVLPKAEICSDGIDQDCDGSDMTPDKAVDIDGDGFTYCTGDCCETGWECNGKDPARISPISYEIAGNGVDDNCDGHIDEEVESICDKGISPDTTNPTDMAASMDLCPAEITTYGVISAKLLYPDGSEGEIEKEQYGVLSSYGNNILPKAGMTFLAFSTGDLNANIGGSSIDTSFNTAAQGEAENHTSDAPADWFQANGGQTFPDSPGCKGNIISQETTDPGKPPVRDPIMLELEIRAPNNAEAFSVDVYYISAEFPQYVCQFNDFFVMLLDSSFKTDNPELQNPADKNIAMDTLGNPLGINLAKSGLFTVCCPRQAYPSCQSDADLKGTPFTTAGCNALQMTENHGATGWLTVRGNIVPKEDFKLRLALWDTNDHNLDSMVLLDHFTWYESAGKAGIVPK